MTCIKVVTEEDPIDVDDGSQNSATVLNGGWLAVKIAALVVIATELLVVSVA
jgi:hypothetical protein